MASVNCGGCLANMDTTSLFMKCYRCETGYHILCVNVSAQEYNSYSDEYLASWLCPNCLCKEPKLGNSNTPICASPTGFSNNITARSTKRKATLSPNVDINQAPTVTSINNNLVSLTSEIRLLREESNSIKGIMENLSACLLKCTTKLESLETRMVSAEKTIQEVKTYGLKVAELTATISSLQDQINSQGQSAIRNELEIMGLNENQNESLEHVILVIASKIRVSLVSEDIDCISRAGLRQQKLLTSENKPPRPLIIRFLRKNKRDEFLRASRTRRDLTTSDIELQGPTRKLYFNEHLTKHNRWLFRETRTRAKEAGYKYCWVKQGYIHIRRREGSPSITIRNASDLERHLGPEELAATAPVGSTNQQMLH
ncbi:unnamed protein product [Parnassius mnemosyne]|uniref:PHD-type domain-containing protein n=1 Tax=Parnassius mnemosyne TaxID=213953 RepID=A0AAV1KBU9_9NEOP